ncbi:adenylate kinase [Saccharopolyspora mangrovi]|uniref:Adenylate kinase n=1 Tax=Saccharopolyspora mangrovi TaxID=3082379 RepID=A0ABU6AGV3_9PSEU|nr:adenylate kinase [Saccharopolyspora sp. S2-29]MEB3370560.1 adenylate kinase [Saccharopolyspora sp. S2-29]
MSATQLPALRIVLIGPPGAGKGTQAKSISAKLGVPHISTGDIFRTNIAGSTPLGIESKSYLDRGELVPDHVTTTMVRQRLGQDDAAAGFLLDGFPRTLSQAGFLAESLDEVGTPLDVVLEMSVERDDVLLRLAGRRTCTSCGSSWHVRFKPPVVHGICDHCSSPLERRADDAEVAINRRLDLYAHETAPLLGFYRRQGVLTTIEASGAVDAVTERMLSVLDA